MTIWRALRDALGVVLIRLGARIMTDEGLGRLTRALRPRD